MTGLAPLLGAIALVALGGLFAAIDAAINTISIARVDELVRDERPGAVRLARVVAERPRYINLVVLLRIVCETTATVLLVAYLTMHLGLRWGLFETVGDHGRHQLRRDRCRSAHRGTAERLPDRIGGRPSAAGDLGPAHAHQPAADPARQRADPRPRIPQRSVRLRDRTAGGGRPRPAARRGGRRRAPDDPVRVRARRHPRARGDGAAHRDGVDRERTRTPGRRRRWRCAAGTPASR